MGSIPPNFQYLHLNEELFSGGISLYCLNREPRVTQSPKLGQMSFPSPVKAGCQYRLLFVGCVCWSMWIQYDRERNGFLHSLEKARLDAAGTEALWFPLAWTNTDGALYLTWLQVQHVAFLLRAEHLLWGAEQPQTSLKSLDRALSYIMRWSCTIYTLRTYAYCTISANIFVRTLF